MTQIMRILLLATAFGPTALANPPPNVVEIQAVQYGAAGGGYRANIVYPTAITSPTTEPVIILMHAGVLGGAEDFMSGSRDDTYIRQRSWDLAGYGFAVLNIDYPVLKADGSVAAVEQLGALQLAIRWVRKGLMAPYIPTFGLAKDASGNVLIGVEGWGVGGLWAMDNAAYGSIWPGTKHATQYPLMSVAVTSTAAVGGVYDWLKAPATGTGSLLTQAYFAGIQPGIGPVPASCPTSAGPADNPWCWTGRYMFSPTTTQSWDLGSANGDQVVGYLKQATPFFQYMRSIDPCPTCAEVFDFGGHDFCNLRQQDYEVLMGTLSAVFWETNFNNHQSPLWGPGFTPVSGYNGLTYTAPAACG